MLDRDAAIARTALTPPAETVIGINAALQNGEYPPEQAGRVRAERHLHQRVDHHLHGIFNSLADAFEAAQK